MKTPPAPVPDVPPEDEEAVTDAVADAVAPDGPEAAEKARLMAEIMTDDTDEG